MNTCKDCNCSFTGYVSQQRCNPCRDKHKAEQCRVIQERRRHKQVVALGGPWPCQHCGKGEIWNRQKKYCSRACYDAVNAEKARYRYQQREQKKAEKALAVLRRSMHPPRQIPRREPTLAAAGNTPSQAALHRAEALTGAAGATVQASSAQKRSE